MRTADPLEPEVEAALEAIDATLAGDPVDPEHAALAELALILRADRPAVDEPFAVAMDARVRDRFAQPSRHRARTPTSARRTARRWPGRGWLVWAPAGALAAVVLVVALVTLVPGGGSSSSSSDLGARAPSAASAVKTPAVSSSSASAASSPGAPHSAGGSSSRGAASSAGSPSAPFSASVPRPRARDRPSPHRPRPPPATARSCNRRGWRSRPARGRSTRSPSRCSTSSAP